MLALIDRDQLAYVTGASDGVIGAATRVIAEMGTDAQRGAAVGGVVGTVGGAVIGGVAPGGAGILPGAWAGGQAGITAGTIVGGAWGLGRGVAREAGWIR